MYSEAIVQFKHKIQLLAPTIEHKGPYVILLYVKEKDSLRLTICFAPVPKEVEAKKINF